MSRIWKMYILLVFVCLFSTLFYTTLLLFNTCPSGCEDYQIPPSFDDYEAKAVSDNELYELMPGQHVLHEVNLANPEYDFFALALSIVNPSAHRRLKQAVDYENLDWFTIWPECSNSALHPIVFSVIFQVTNLLKAYAEQNVSDSVTRTNIFTLWQLAYACFQFRHKEMKSRLLPGNTTLVFSVNGREHIKVFIWGQTTELIGEIFNFQCNSVCHREYNLMHFPKNYKS